MSFRSRIRAAVAAFAQPGNRVLASGGVPDWAQGVLGHPYVPAEDLGNFRDAFRKVPVVGACIGQIQQDVAKLPRRVYQGEGEQRREIARKEGNLVDLLHKANPRDTGYEFWVNTVGSLFITGNVYWIIQRYGSNPAPAELWCFPSHEMQVVPGPNRGVVSYRYRSLGDWVEVPAERVIHIRDYNPDDEPIGMSRLESVRKDFEAQFYALIWLKEFFRKGGMLSGVWSIKDTSVRLQKTEIDAIVDTLRSKHMGYDKAWDPVVLQGMEFIQQGLTLSEMEIDKHLGIMNANVARRLGVPPWMIGIKEGSTLGQTGAASDTLLYWEGPVERTVRLIDAVVNERLAPMFGRGITVETDMSGVLAVQEARANLARTLVTLTGRPVLTVNRALEIMGEPPSDDPTANELYVKQQPTFGLEGLARLLRGDRPALPAARPVRAMIDGDDVREELRRKATGSLGRATARMERFVRGRLADQQATAISRLTERFNGRRPTSGAGLERIELVIDLDGLMDAGSDEDREKARKMLEELLRVRGVESIAELEDVAGVVVEIEVAMSSDRAARFLDTQVERAITVPDGTTAAALRESLAEGVSAGEGLAELTERVRTVFAGREAMAGTIARTETLPAYNFATLEAWEQSGIVEKKEWLTARDDVVRPAHDAADGDVVPMDGAFTLTDPDTGETGQADYPGDPDLPPGLSINCRCTIQPVVSQDLARGLKWDRFWRDGATNGNGGSPPRNRVRDIVQGHRSITHA